VCAANGRRRLKDRAVVRPDAAPGFAAAARRAAVKNQHQWGTARRLVLDGLLLAAMFVGALLVHGGWRIPDSWQDVLPVRMAVTVTITLCGLAWARVHRKMIDFAGLRDFVALVKGMSVAFLVLVVANALVTPRWTVPWPVLLTYFALSGCAMSLGLFKLRLWRQTPLSQARRGELPPSRRAVLVYGAGRAGSAVAAEIVDSPELGYELRGYLDDDPGKWGKELHGIPVLGGRHDLPRLVGPGLRELVLAIPSLDAEDRREILTHCRRAGAHVRIVPGLADLLREGSYVHQIRDVRVEDLLPREAVELEESEVREQLSGETVLVTGAAGSIGSELCHQILRHEPRQLILFEQSESRLYFLEMELQRRFGGKATQLVPVVGDICDRERLEHVMRSYRPSHIFHAAAYKHVPMMQRHPYEAIRNNVFGTHTVAQLAHHYRVGRFVLVSTDKAVEPTSVMGASKRVAELLVRELQQDSQTRFIAVRFGNVLDSDGSVVPLFKKQISDGGPITITHPEMERYFMTIPEAARLILQATAMGEGGEVFVLEMGKPVKILDLARSLVELSGLRFLEDIEVNFTGMRPGEKLTEKLFFEHERSVPTRSRQIHVAQLENGRRLDLDEFLRSLTLLTRTAADERDLGLRFMALVSGLDSPETAPAETATWSQENNVVPLRQAVGKS
jgi:FlaA1/EpsC-like NDP-sugar epimerase